jgi:hypothetical protein
VPAVQTNAALGLKPSGPKYSTAPVSHQKRSHQSTTKETDSERKRRKINKPDRYPAAHNGLVAGSSAVRTNNEINSWSDLRSRWTLAPSIGEVPSSSERLCASPLTPKKSDNQKTQAASFLFVRCGTQSYDELIAAVPLRRRLSMMLGMVDTSDIFGIGENASACISSGRTSATR